MTSRKRKSIIAAIERHMVAIAKHRDELRDIRDDLESCIESSDRGLQELDAAVAALSEYV